jgi:hypothetical protein
VRVAGVRLRVGVVVVGALDVQPEVDHRPVDPANVLRVTRVLAALARFAREGQGLLAEALDVESKMWRAMFSRSIGS